MKYRKLGSSDLLVSEIAFGSWLTFSSAARKQNAVACVHRALDRGVTLFDTGIKRDSVVLATKLFFPMSDTDRGLSRAQIEKQIDASLARLQVSYVDLYQCHRYDAQTPLEETLEALTRVVRAGKARYIGFSEWPIDRIEAALAMPQVEKFVSSQPQYSLLHRDPEHVLLPLCARSGISQIVWSPLAQGVLTGKYAPGAPFPTDSRAADDSMKGFLSPAWFKPEVLRAIQALRPLAKQAGLTLAQFSLAWVLRQPNVAAAIIGASQPDQVDENVAASGQVLSPDLVSQAEKLLGDALRQVNRM
jgi:aryl-alcohol dehydrogenase-like predicted oxidoreductase